MEKSLLREHIDYIIRCTRELGLSRSLTNDYVRGYEAVFLYCMANRIDTLTEQEASDFCRLHGKNHKKYTAGIARKAAYTVFRYFEEGRFIWERASFSSNNPVSKPYRELINQFSQKLSERLSPETVRKEMVIIRQFLAFLEHAGIVHQHSITSGHVLDFVRRKAPDYKGTMPTLLRSMRNFVRFLRERGTAGLDADRFLCTAGRCRQKALPCFTDDELRAVFARIDRTTAVGRRDYAIFLLATRTGMRAADISKLKLADISWTEKTIMVEQKKTRVSLVLPLPVDVGNAITDYILYARPRVDSPYIFLRMLHPVPGIPVSPSLFNVTLRKYMASAGIVRTGRDGKTFHALRRTAGTKMVAAGVPVPVIAQILGHKSIESSKRYISLDMESLRGCCLDLGEMHTRKEGLM